MMKKSFGVGLLLVTLGAVLLSACRQGGGATVTLRAVDSGRTVELKKGDTLIVELEGNPTTGMSWEVEAVDEAVLKQQGDPEYKAGEPGMMGGGGVFLFRFQVAGKGETILQMVYHQSWDEETPPAQVFEATVIVQ